MIKYRINTIGIGVDVHIVSIFFFFFRFDAATILTSDREREGRRGGRMGRGARGGADRAGQGVWTNE